MWRFYSLAMVIGLTCAIFGCVDDGCLDRNPADHQYGKCNKEIGWVWDGDKCVVLNGCETPGDNAVDIFDTPLECRQSCAD